MRRIFIYTGYYPYSEMSESFLAPELKVMAETGCSVTLIPVNSSGKVRPLPDGVSLDKSICESNFLHRMWILLGVVRFLPYLSLRRIFRLKKISYLFDAIKYLYASNLVYHDLKRRAEANGPAVFYSYWLSYVPIAFALYKQRKRNTQHFFVARGHGSDIYGEKVGVYYPLRDVVFNNIDRIFVISKFGIEFLQNNYPQLIGKLSLARLGVFDNVSEKKKVDNIVRIVSCSSVIPLKRVNLVFDSIRKFAMKNPQLEVEWTHIGDGPLFPDLQKYIQRSEGSGNLKVLLCGGVDNSEILKLYREKVFNCFVLLSTTEGIPVSIMEAISSGIPVIATNVGGISEIVNEETGILLNRDFDQRAFDNALSTIIKDNVRLSKSSHRFFQNNYDARENFTSFISSIKSLGKEAERIVFILGFSANQNAIKRIKEFSARGYDVQAYGFARDNRIFETPNGVDVSIIGSYPTSTPYLKRIGTLLNGIKHVLSIPRKGNTLYYCFGLDVTTLFKILCNYDYIYEEEDLMYTYFSNKLLVKWFSRIDRYVVKHSLLTVFTSEGFSNYHYGKARKDNIVVIPNRLKKEVVNYKPINKSVDMSQLKIGFVGSFRFMSVYNFAKVFSMNFPECEFHFFGGTSNSEDQQLFSKLSKYKNIFFHGRFKNPQDLPVVYSQFDLLLSTYDIMFENVRYAEPNKIYEAIYFKKPIIATEGTYLGDKIKKLGIGYTVNPLDDQNIVDFVRRLTVESYQRIVNNITALPPDFAIDNYDVLFAKLNQIKQ